MTDAVKGDKELIRRLTMIGLQDGRYGPRILRTWQIRTTQLAKVRAPKRTGNLERSISPGPIGRTAAQVTASAAYAGYVEHGTRPHLIRPVRARMLAWNNTPGATRLSGNLRSGVAPNVFARLVHHPGTVARPFLQPAAEEALRDLDLSAEITTAWNDAA